MAARPSLFTFSAFHPVHSAPGLPQHSAYPPPERRFYPPGDAMSTPPPLAGRLVPLRTKDEVRASLETHSVYVVEVPAKFANVVKE
jgi:hypothetical protein